MRKQIILPYFPLAKVQQLKGEISSVLTVTYSILMKLNFRVLYMNCRRPKHFSLHSLNLFVGRIQNISIRFRMSKKLWCRLQILFWLHSIGADNQLFGEKVWLLGPCSPCLSHIICLTTNHTYIPILITILTFCIYTAILFLFFIFFTLKFDTAIHPCIRRYRIWTLWFLHPYSYTLTTSVCYLQYSSFLSTNNSIICSPVPVYQPISKEEIQMIPGKLNAEETHSHLKKKFFNRTQQMLCHN